MSEHRVVFTPAAGSSFSRRRRWVTGAVGALGASGLIFGGLARAASPSDPVGGVRLDVWTDVHGSWVGDDGSVSGAAGSAYGEGQTVPFRLDLTADGPGTFDFSVCRAYANGAVRGFLSLESYLTSRTPPIAPGAVVTDVAGGSDQPFTGAAVGGRVDIDAVREVGGPGACGPGWRETQVRVTLTSAASGSSPVGAYVLWGGRLAPPAAPDVGPGGGVSMRLASSAEIRSGADATVDVDATADLNLERNPDGDPPPSPDPDPDPTPPPIPDPDPTPLPDPITVPDPGPVVTPDPDEAVPPGLDPPGPPGTDPGERCASSRTTPRCGDDHEPAGDPPAEIGDPETVGSTTGVDSAAIGVGGGDDPAPAPLAQILGRDVEQTAPASAESPAGAGSPSPAGAALPKTGGGPSTGALRVLGLVALGRALRGRTRRRRTARP